MSSNPRRSTRKKSSKVATAAVVSPSPSSVCLREDRMTSSSSSSLLSVRTRRGSSAKNGTTRHSRDEKVRGRKKVSSEEEDVASSEFVKATSNASKGKLKKTRSSIPKQDDEETTVSSPYFDKKRKRASYTGLIGDHSALTQNETMIVSNISQDSISSERLETTIQAARGEMTCQLVNEPLQPGEPDGNGGLYNPFFRVEYSMTGRATCRRCDMKIDKGVVRVAHRPLFRGKPGFEIYRHLQCAVFDENVQRVEDIDGLSDLEDTDKQRLALRLEESKEELVKEQEVISPDELVAKKFEGSIRNSPLGLNAELLPFQIEGVSWMYAQETKEDIRGGILADEMGMGKTIQTITLMLDNKPTLQHHRNDGKNSSDFQVEDESWKHSLREWNTEMIKSNVPENLQPKGGPLRAGTLVVCPVIALDQWKQEIEKFTKDSALTVGIYHGQNRTSSLPRELLCKYDVVLTTYQVIEADFRKMASPNKVKCPNCGKKFKIDRLKLHLKYYCGEFAERTEAQARQIRASERGNQSTSSSHVQSKNAAKGKKSITKKKVNLKSMDDEIVYKSDSSVQSTDKKVNARYGIRSARKIATKKLSAYKSYETGSSESSFSYESDDDDNDDDDDDEYVNPTKSRKKTTKGKVERTTKDIVRKRNRKTIQPSVSSSEESDDELNAAAIESQRKALETARFGKKDKKEKKQYAKKGTKQNKRDKNVDADDENAIDIDMDQLIEEAQSNSCMSILHSMCWWRIVLDEAHIIKSRSSQTAAAAFALIGIHRWCLSGTPLQNRVGEFYSLVRFLRIDPMAHYFCRARKCSCKSLHYRMFDGKCQDCGHGSVQHYSQFNKYILNPIKRDGYSGDGRRAMFALKNEVLDKCLLRRTKDTNAADMKLPNRLVKIREVNLHPVEEDFYNALYTQSKTTFNDYVSRGNLLNNYAHVFDLLIRMAVDHPYLVLFSKNGIDSTNELASEIPVANGSVTCSMCHEDPTDRVLSTCCSSAFCRGCVIDYMSTAEGLGSNENGIPCPSCRSPFSIDLSSQVQDENLSESGKEQVTFSKSYNEGMPLLKELSHVPSNSVLRRVNLAEFATSTKIEALTEELIKMRKTSPGSKAIVFSQFVNMLDLIRWRLHSDPCLKGMGIGVASLHGGMNVKVREENIRSFKEDVDVKVLLVSLKAGGVALNLTVANYIFLMDPWWNPAAEMQAIDRTHRIGQYRPIRAVRFIAANTVESRILQLQEKKRLVFDGTVGRDAASLKALTADDMKCLFS